MTSPIRLRPNRRFPSIPAVSDDLRNHTQVLTAMKEAVEVGKRDTSDVLNSYIRVKDLVDMGFATLESGLLVPAQFASGGGRDQTAEEVPYDNSASGLAASDVQAALDELAYSGGTDDQTAAEVPYNNAVSGLAGTNVQAAIDELATGTGGVVYLGEFSPSGDDLDVVLPSAYQDFRLIIRGTAGAANSQFSMRWSNDGGATFLSTNQYKTGGNGGAGSISIITSGVGAGRRFLVVCELAGFNDTTHSASQLATATGVASSGAPFGVISTYATTNTGGPMNAVRFYANTATGMGSDVRARLYGYKT